MAIEQPLTKGTLTTASVSTQEVWQEAWCLAETVTVSKSASAYWCHVPHIGDPHSLWVQLSLLFEHHTVFARTFFLITCCPEQPRACIPGPAFIINARRLLHHSRTNVLDHVSIVAFCVLDKISDCLAPFEMIAQVRETLIKEGMISAKGLAEEKHLQRVAVSCRACPLKFFFDINGTALAATRFMTRDDHAFLRTTSNNMSQSMSVTSSAVIPSKVLVADLEGHTELFDTTSGRWETLSCSVSRDPRTSVRVRRLESRRWEGHQLSRVFQPASEEGGGRCVKCLCPE